MANSGESDGWAPPDPAMAAERPSEPEPAPSESEQASTSDAEAPHGRSPHGHRPHVQGPSAADHGGRGALQHDPYAAGPYPPAPYPPAPYAPTPYTTGAFAQGAPVQAPYGPAPHGQGLYGQAPHRPGPHPYPYGTPPAKTPWLVEAPPGTPFHRLARTRLHRWWHPLVGTVMIVAVGVGLLVGLMLIAQITFLAATGELPEPPADDETALIGNDVADLALSLIMIAIFLPVALLAAWSVQRRRPGTLSSVTGRLRWRWLLICCGLAVLFCAVGFGMSLLAETTIDDPSGGDEHWVGWGDFLLPAVIILLLVPFQSASEEYIFRGWIQQAVGACTLENSRRKAARALSVVLRTPWPGILIASVLFTGGHGYTGWGMLDIFGFAVVMGWMTVRTGGLEAAIALHVFNNLVAFMFSAAVGQLDIEQGAVPWQIVAADLVSITLYAVVVVLLARRLRIQTVSPDPADADDAPKNEDTSPAPVS